MYNSININTVFKGVSKSSSNSITGNLLLVFQYTLSITLIACSLLILKQTTFLKNFDVGFKTNNILHINFLGNKNQKETIKNKLLQLPEVSHVSFTWSNFLTGGSNQSFEHNGNSLSFQEIKADSSFFKLFDIKMTPINTPKTNNSLYLNQLAYHQLHLAKEENTFFIENEKISIIGVFDNFNINKLNKPIAPFAIRPLGDNDYPSKIYIKLQENSLSKTVFKKIRQTYASFTNGNPFDINFVDQTIQDQYQKEERFGKIVSFFTILSIVISFMGIFALSLFYMQHRKKEIGIRKVNGATTFEIVNNLNLHFIKWVIAAFLLATPIAYYAINEWLKQFSYKTNISWWVFVIAGASVFTIAFLTVSWQSLKASTTNPIKSLRTE